MPLGFNSLNLRRFKRIKLKYCDGTCSIKDLVLCDNFFTRSRGMLFQRKEDHRKAFLLTKCNAIHTFFMAYPIDIIFLSKEGEILSQLRVETYSTASVKNAYAVIEGTKLLKSNNSVCDVEFLC